MSAYSGPRSAQLINLSAGGLGGHERLPLLPEIGRELEAYFAVAKQLEAGLGHERALTKKLKEDLEDLQARYARAVADAELRLKELHLRDEKMREQVNVYHRRDQMHAQEVDQLKREIERLREENASLRREHDQDQRDKLDAQRKHELELGLLRANLDHLKQREESTKSMLTSLQFKEGTFETKVQELERQRDAIQAELGRYKSAWSQAVAADRRARQIMESSREHQFKAQELIEQLAIEKRRREEVEGSISKERREKQIALNCLQTAETQIDELKRELQALRERAVRKFDDRTIELQF